ncbi:MAG: hypothetical protein GY822_13325 [Deltaproteobacteria bacterium]|nr:hypothetical protein [Deltaproteobacteria bacterium]
MTKKRVLLPITILLLVFIGGLLSSCDREAQLRLNWFGERELFIDLCCSCLAKTEPSDAGISVVDVDAGALPLVQNCLLGQTAEQCAEALKSDGTFELQGSCVLDEKSPCDYACNGVLGYLSDDV